MQSIEVFDINGTAIPDGTEITYGLELWSAWRFGTDNRRYITVSGQNGTTSDPDNGVYTAKTVVSNGEGIAKFTLTANFTQDVMYQYDEQQYDVHYQTSHLQSFISSSICGFVCNIMTTAVNGYAVFWVITNLAPVTEVTDFQTKEKIPALDYRDTHPGDDQLTFGAAAVQYDPQGNEVRPSGLVKRLVLNVPDGAQFKVYARNNDGIDSTDVVDIKTGVNTYAQSKIFTMSNNKITVDIRIKNVGSAYVGARAVDDPWETKGYLGRRDAFAVESSLSLVATATPTSVEPGKTVSITVKSNSDVMSLYPTETNLDVSSEATEISFDTKSPVVNSDGTATFTVTTSSSFNRATITIKTPDNKWASTQVNLSVPRAADPTAPIISDIQTGPGSLDVNYVINMPDQYIDHLEYSLDGGITWISPSPAVKNASPLHIEGLADGVYSVMLKTIPDDSIKQYLTPEMTGKSKVVTATIGGVNPSPTPTPTDTATPTPTPTPTDTASPTPTPTYTTPSAPRILGRKNMDSQVRLRIKAPKKDGGKPVLSYEYTVDGGKAWLPAQPWQQNGKTFFYAKNLTNGTRYIFSVRALNEIGYGETSNIRKGYPRRVPDAPAIQSIAKANQRLDVSFIPPADNGGLRVLRYVASVNGGAWVPTTWRSALNILEVHGLKNKRTYSIKIAACSAAGCSLASNEMSGTTK